MDPRDIIYRDTDPWSNEDPLTVLVDTPSMNEQISYGNDAARRLLQYHENSSFTFIRTPETARYPEIEAIHPYSVEEEDGERKSLRVNSEVSDHGLAVGFLYKDEDIRNIAGRVYENKKEKIDVEVDPTEEQVDTVRKVFVQASINWNESGEVFVTENEVILSNRRWFESHFPGQQLNIMALDEAIEYLGLYSRFRDEYPIRPRYKLDKAAWYWTLFRDLLPYFHVELGSDDRYLRGFRTRVENLLIATEELGYQYFQKPDNRTQLNMQYHFDHAITLISGAFDALALKTTVEYNIEGIEKEYISVSNNRGREFLSEVREENSDLRDHIADHMPFINLIYTLRPLIVHRDGYMETQFDSEQDDWSSRMIALHDLDDEYRDEFFRYYKEIDDEPEPYDPISVWGIYEPETTEFEFLEPYHFVKSATRELVHFSNDYFKMLGYDDYFSEKDGGVSDRWRGMREDALTPFYKEIK